MSDAAQRAVLYVRLSRETAVSTSIQGQNDELYARAQQEGWDIVATFEDNGRSGGKQRDNAQEALAMIRDGRADVLAVYAYDRWSRMGIADSADIINAVYARAKTSRPARFVAMREGIDSDREGWELLTAFTADIAQKERQRMVQRRTAAIGRMRADGRNPGNGPAPYGYRSASFDDGRPGRRFVVDPEEAAILRSVADGLLAGQSAAQLAKGLNSDGVAMPHSPFRLAVLAGKPTTDPATGEQLPKRHWTSGRLAELMRSDHLLGRVRVNTSRAAGGRSNGELLLDPKTGLPATPFEPVLDVETFDALKKRFSPTGPRRERAAYLLSGLVYCGLCGSPMYGIKHSGSIYFRCSAGVRAVECPIPKIAMHVLEALVLDDYRKTFGRMRAFDSIEHVGSPEVDRELLLLAEQVSALGAQLAAETDDDRAATLFAQMRTLKKRRATLEALPRETTVERVYTGDTVGDRFDAAPDVESRRKLLRDAYDHIQVFRKVDEKTLGYRIRCITTLEYDQELTVDEVV